MITIHAFDVMGYIKTNFILTNFILGFVFTFSAKSPLYINRTKKILQTHGGDKNDVTIIIGVEVSIISHLSRKEGSDGNL